MRASGLFGMLMAAAVGMAGVSAQAQVVVILSSKNPISKLTPDQVAQVFLGQAKTFYTGGLCEPVDQAEGVAVRTEFYQKVTGKNAAQMKAYWAKLTFSGNGQPPQSVANGEALVKLVAENPKFIGYVDKALVNTSVKIVLAP